MKILLTGSSGRIGRAIYGALAGEHEVIGVDRKVFSTTHILGDFTDPRVIEPALEDVDGVIHVAGPHAPHVGHVSDAEFERVNVQGTVRLYEAAREAGAGCFLYTSTTALYGSAIRDGECVWVDERTEPQPKSVYHATKFAAEKALEDMARGDCPVRVLRMSRCFPEPAPAMAAYRLHRGVDARDVASGHVAALTHQGAAFERFVLSGTTPFVAEDCEMLATSAPEVIRQRAPELTHAFDERGWQLPQMIDRIYSSGKAQAELGWRPQWGWHEVLAQADRASLEVLPAGANPELRSE